jgi:hypothetical protein
LLTPRNKKNWARGPPWRPDVIPPHPPATVSIRVNPHRSLPRVPAPRSPPRGA